jgi:hypothetical protein
MYVQYVFLEYRHTWFIGITDSPMIDSTVLPNVCEWIIPGTMQG